MGILISIFFCSPYLFGSYAFENAEDQKVVPQLLVLPRAKPVISPSLERYLSSCQPEDSVKVWVFFTDKGIFSLEQYEDAKTVFKSSLTRSALKRRLKNRAETDFLDLPINQFYADEILKSGGILRQKSRWLNAISIQIQKNKIEKIAQLPFVREIKKVVGFKREPEEIQSIHGKLYQPEKFAGYGRNYGPSLPQLDQINVPIVHDMGYKGQNVIVCMMDTGYRKNHQAFAIAYSESRVLAEYDFIFHDNNTQNEPEDTVTQHDHGTATWSALGGEYEEWLYGPAYGSSFVLAKTEDVRSETPIEEDNWVAGMEWADSIGAEIISSSLGYSNWYTYSDFDGNTCVTTVAADIAASRGIVVCNAMGNEGSGAGTLIAPADADSIIACGAVDEWGIIASFSSRGPTYDGRIKPEVVARGVATYCASAFDTNTYFQIGGTSLSTPLVGGCAAVLLSAHPDWTVMQIREALMMTANNASAPNNTYGWGLVNLFEALNYAPSGALTIQHDPPLFTSDTLNPYIMHATITPGNGLDEDSLFLFWRSDTLSPFTKQNLQSVGSNQYQGEIPAQSPGKIIYYYFSAQDSLNNVVNFPLGAPHFKFEFYVNTDVITFDFEDGLFHWETGGIINSWNWTSVSAHSGRFSLTDSPQGGYKNNTDSWADIKKTFDLTGIANPQFSFWYRYQFRSGDTGFVEINTDGGKGWERIFSGFVGTVNEWAQVNLPLDSYIGYSNVKFRFHFTSNAVDSGDGWYIDDVQINFKPTSVEEEPTSVPFQFSLYQNYPNPFNPVTRIQYTVGSRQIKAAVSGLVLTVQLCSPSLSEVEGSEAEGRWTTDSSTPITLKIYNILGQKVRTLADEPKSAGNYEVIWDGRNDKGEEVASGLYFYQLSTENNRITKKMLLLR